MGRGNPRLSDAEKKRRGTFRADQSEAAYARKDAEKLGAVLSGPWLNHIPEPDLPLGEFGRQKYDTYTRQLLDAGRLTQFARDQAEIAALMHQQIADLVNDGKTVKAAIYNQLRSAIRDLRLSENATPIAGRRAASKFDGCGFANRRDSQVRLRLSSEADA